MALNKHAHHPDWSVLAEGVSRIHQSTARLWSYSEKLHGPCSPTCVDRVGGSHTTSTKLLTVHPRLSLTLGDIEEGETFILLAMTILTLGTPIPVASTLCSSTYS